MSTRFSIRNSLMLACAGCFFLASTAFAYNPTADLNGGGSPNSGVTQDQAAGGLPGSTTPPPPATASGTQSSQPLVTPQLEIQIPNVTFTPALESACPNTCQNNICQQSGDACTTNADCPESSSTCLTVNWVTQYVTGFYKFLVGFSVLVAVIMVMIGGIQYVMSANTGDTKLAKERITNAVVGFILLCCVELILVTVGGNWLGSFSTLTVKEIQEVPLDNQIDFNSPTGGSCSANLFGVNSYQDCMLKKYGSTQSAIQLENVTFDGQIFQVNTDIAANLEAANQELIDSGISYPIVQDGASGGFNWRCNKNKPAALSDHAFGTAIDINPSTNPNCPAACLDPQKTCNCIGGNNCKQQCTSATPYTMPQAIVNALVNNGFAWGGNYKKTKDYMHFSFNSGC